LNSGKQLSVLTEGLDFEGYSPEDIKELVKVFNPIVRMDLRISEEDDREWIEMVSVPKIMF